MVVIVPPDKIARSPTGGMDQNYVAEVVLGLEYLHQRGIVHR